MPNTSPWYVQGFTGVPVYLNLAALSGFTMKEDMGIAYTHFLLSYKDGYGEMSYLRDDLSRMWKLMKKEIAEDPHYLQKLHNKYDTLFARYRHDLENMDTLPLTDLSDEQLVSQLIKSGTVILTACTIAHSIEAISIELDKEFREELKNMVKNGKDFNQIYAELTTPDTLSFISHEENALRGIAELSEKEQRVALVEHQKKYRWIRNSYLGAHEPTLREVKAKMKRLAGTHKRLAESVNHEAILTPSLKEKVSIIRFAIAWQDERKANILKSISLLSRDLKETSRRIRVPLRVLEYLGAEELLGLTSFQDIKTFLPLLKERSLRGVYFEFKNGKEKVISKERYLEESKMKKVVSANEIHGQIANRGTASGRVVVCKGLQGLSKVEEGDVLVTSMTRPEYMTVLRKVAAIVTDEGGVTCHAAVVSREFNIPAVIGTLHATRVLQDGMMVEVRANHGLVRILSS